MSIPVLIVPVLNRPDLLEAMLRSVDTPVERLIVIDNSRHGETSAAIDWDHWQGERTILACHHNLGVAASWNLGVKLSPKARWWAFANSDLVYHPGDLERFAAYVDANPGVTLFPDFTTFGVTPSAFDDIGWFDENFIPAYCEDNDFYYRAQLAQVPLVGLPASPSHTASATIRSDPHYRDENGRTYPQNVHYYRLKWGGEMHGEVYQKPFDTFDDIRRWELAVTRLAVMSWAE